MSPCKENKMKRIIALFLACLLLFGTVACAKNPPVETTQSVTQPTTSVVTLPKMVTVTLDANGGSCQIRNLFWQRMTATAIFLKR